MRISIISQLFFLFLILQCNMGNAQHFGKKKPKVVVGIVVEQMRYEMISRYWDVLSDDGFKKLVTQGTTYTNAYHDYFLTPNSVGVASMVTGTYPSDHGIVSDHWVDKLTFEETFCIKGESKKLSNGFIENGNYSPEQLLAPTIGDEIKMAFHDSSKVLSIGMNPVSSVLGGGKAADYAFWFDDIHGKWTTGHYYTDSIPEWVNTFNAKGIHDIYMSRSWATSYELSKNYNQSLPDNNPFEYGFENYRKTFPYELKYLKQRAGNYKYLKYTPYGVTYTKDFALSAIIEEGIGIDEYPDFVFISFSAGKYINELFGPRSVEMEDFIIKLDQEIAHLLNFFESNVGVENTLVFVTSDRGVSELPTYREHLDQRGGEFDIYQSFTLLESYLDIYYQQGDWISGYSGKQLFLNRATIDRCGAKMDELQDLISDFMTQYQGISHAMGTHSFQKTDFDQGVFSLMQNSFHQKRSGDIFINYEHGWTEKGIPYSEMNDAAIYNRHVPLIWYGWNVKKNLIVNRKVEIIDIAPTISHTLKISAPAASQGSPMLDIID